MSSDDLSDDESPDSETQPGANVRERLEEEADRAVDGFDEGIVDLLSWVLETETRARIYVYLRQQSHSTSDEIAEGTGLYPSTVREALAELHEEEKVSRQKRENDGAGNNPYEYAAMAPSELVGDIVDDVQSELNTVFNLDDYLGPSDNDNVETDSEPVTITVEDAEASDEDEGHDEAASEEGEDADTGESDDDSAGEA
jgi:predicted transcriptional regulator